jgi:hypothetical protein
LVLHAWVSTLVQKKSTELCMVSLNGILGSYG